MAKPSKAQTVNTRKTRAIKQGALRVTNSGRAK